MSEPRIILWDIETLPNLPEALKVWTQLSNYPGLTFRASITSIICAGWKVYGRDNEVQCISAWDFPSRWKADVNDDSAVCKEISKVLANADCVVTHNGKKFDWKFLQTRLLYHRLPPLPKIHHVDTREVASRNLFVFNNKLQTLARFLTSEEKMENGGWDLWVDVHARKEEAQKTMVDYCKQDVVTLEELFREIRPFTKIINHNHFGEHGKNSCPNCGSTRLKSNGLRYTQTRTYRRYICADCNTWSRTDAKDGAPRTD